MHEQKTIQIHLAHQKSVGLNLELRCNKPATNQNGRWEHNFYICRLRRFHWMLFVCNAVAVRSALFTRYGQWQASYNTSSCLLFNSPFPSCSKWSTKHIPFACKVDTEINKSCRSCGHNLWQAVEAELHYVIRIMSLNRSGVCVNCSRPFL